MNAKQFLYFNILVGMMALIIIHLQPTPTLSQEEHEDEDEYESLEISPVRRFWHLTSDYGLVQNNVLAILQDRNGFMWFGTEGGLTRYDGYNFVTFVSNPDDPNSLQHNTITGLAEAEDGTIWISTEGGGIHSLDPITMQFTPIMLEFIEDDNSQRILHDRHNNIMVDSQGIIWAGGGPVGLSKYDPIAGEYENLLRNNGNQNGLRRGFIHDVIESPNHELWLAASITVIRHDLETGTFTGYPFTEAGDELFATTILIDTNDEIWAGGERGLWHFDESSDAFIQILPGIHINDILETEDGLLWLATARGISLFDVQAGEIVAQEEGYIGISDSLQNSSVRVLSQDQSGKIWLGGADGLDVYDPRTTRFAYYRHQIQDEPATLTNGIINSMHAQDDHVVWVGVQSYLHRLDFASGDVDVYELDHFGIDLQSISALTSDLDGYVWISAENAQLVRFDPTTEQFEDFTDRFLPTFNDTLAIVRQRQRPGDGPQSPPSGERPQQQPPNTGQVTLPTVPINGPESNMAAVDLHVDSDNNLWITMPVSGVYRYNESRTEFETFPAPLLSVGGPVDGSGPTGFPPFRASSVDQNGDFWFASPSAAIQLDVESNTFTGVNGFTGRPITIDDVFVDRDGIIWFATRDGLMSFDPETETSRGFTSEDGLPTNNLSSILQAENGDLWIGTKRGISHFDRTAELFTNYTLFDGLQGNEFDAGLAAQMSDGRMLFGGSNGLTAFYPENIVKSDFQPTVIIDNFELFNEPVQPGEGSPLSQPIWLTDSITLAPSDDILTFEFAALNFPLDQSNEYRYRLEGLEDHWIETDSSRRFATYTNLSPGDYVFRVQATNGDGVWSENEVAISLIVLPHFWETIWFRLLVIASIVVLFILGNRWRMRRISRRNKELQHEVDIQTHALQARTQELQASEEQLRKARDAAEAANKAKSAFLANMSHELRSPLNAILGFTQLAHRNITLETGVRDNLGIVLRSGEHLLSLINQVLDLSKIEANRMVINTSNFDLYRLLDDLEDMFSLIAEKKHLTFTVNYSKDVPRYIRADRMKLRQTLINLISNALKFTERGYVNVQVNLDDDQASPGEMVRLLFSVEDTGPGISEKEQALLFDAFSQTTAGRDSHEGTGLGLVISRKFVRLMGGDINIKSAIDNGTTFSFDIACTVAEASDIQSTHIYRRITGLAEDQPRYRILIVDDRWTNRQLLQQLLKPLGFELQEATNGQEAVDLAKSFEPHLILMDIRMPVMNGVEAIRLIRQLPTGKSVKIIVLTASTFDEEDFDLYKVGCNDIMRKPIDSDQLFDSIQTQIGVRYVYADNSEGEKSAATSPAVPSEQISELLEAIPSSLILRLAESVELGDFDEINDIVDEFSKIEPTLGEALRTLTKQFRFSDMLELLRNKIKL